MKRFYFSKLLVLVAILLGWNLSAMAQLSPCFSYTGSVQYYTVPLGVFSITVDMQGATGGTGAYSYGVGGNGGRVECTLASTPGSVLQIYVGGAGTSHTSYYCCTPYSTNAGGYNGGGAGYDNGAGGGGASDIRTSGGALTNRLVVAAGGGGGAYDCTGENGGAGGGYIGGNGIYCSSYNASYCGQGAQYNVGGKGSTSGPGGSGTLGLGGNAYMYYYGGGGGGGYYGGGGGYYGSGGGGSSYGDTLLATGKTFTSGYNSSGNGSVCFTDNCTSPVGGTIMPPAAPFCGTGQTALFSDTSGSPGGVWSSSNLTTGTIDSVTGIFTSITAGTSTVPTTTVISYTLTYACGNALATYTVSVYGFPSPISANAPLCQGSSLILSEAGLGTWTSSNAGLATVDYGPNSTSTLTGVAAGNPVITYTLPSGCISTATASVNPVPAAITSPSGRWDFCAGDTLALSEASTGGAWSSGPPSGVVSVSGSGVVSNISGSGATLISYTYPPMGTAVGCTATTTVTVDPVPTAYSVNVSGGSPVGTYCAGTPAPTSIQTNGSDLGTNYQLVRNGVNYGSPFPGIGGSPVSWGIVDSPGTYTSVATTAYGCAAALSGSGVISINPAPNIIPLIAIGSATFCGGVGSVDLMMDSVQSDTDGSDVTYFLYNTTSPGTQIGFAGYGVGGTNDFGPYSSPGIYYATAINSSGCTSNMIDSITVTNNPLPNVYNVSSFPTATNLCPGASVHILLGPSSDPGIRYDLYFNSSPTGVYFTGSSASLDFGAYSAVGNYQVLATNMATGCTSWMTGAINITANPVPAIDTISAGGAYCYGSPAGIDLTLNASEASTNYQLVFNGVPTGAPVAGTGSGTLDLGSDTSVGNYTVVATNSYGCVSNMHGTATIDTYNRINRYPVSGGGAYCAGGTGYDIQLLGSDPDPNVSYQVYMGSSYALAPLTGTGGVLDFGLDTTGVYTVTATNIITSCSVTMSGSAVITTNPLPAVDTVTGGGNYCTGGSGVHIGLNYSDLGVKYQLYNDGALVPGSDLPGSATALDYGLRTDSGVYSVVAMNTATGCSSNMSGSAVVSSSLPPAVYDVTASGSSYCAGGSGVDVMLSSSAPGIDYQVMLNGSPLDTLVSGTGLGLDFGNQTAPGAYTVVASNGANGCSSNMFGAATVVINPLPVVYSVTGGGNYCAGGTGEHVGLNMADPSISYQLYNTGIVTGSAVNGLGSALDFGLQTVNGSYTVIATNTATKCTSNMSDSAAINIEPLPNVYAVTGGGTDCAGGSGFNIGLGGSDNGVTYRLYNSSAPVGTTVPGTNVAINFGVFAPAGTYTVMATNDATHCANNMSGSAVINVNPAPAQYTVYGGGAYCAGSGGEHIYISGSSYGDNYQLYNGRAATGSPMTATGSYLDFGADTAGGIYTVVATNALTGCSANMLSSSSITVNPLPATYSVTGGGHYCTGGTGADVSLSWSTAGITYQLYNGFMPVGASRPGGGIMLDYGLETAAGPYTVVAKDMITGCTSNMAGSVSVIIDPLVTPGVTISTGSGDIVCSGVVTSFVGMPVNGGTSPIYLWAVNGSRVSVGDTLSYVANDGDIVSVTMTSSASCTSSPIAVNSSIMSVKPFETPMASITASPGSAVCEGSTVKFDATTVNGGLAPSYSWILNSKVVASGTSYSYTPADSDVIILLLGSNYPCRTSDSALSNTFKMEVDPSIPPIVNIISHPGTLLAPGQLDTLDATVKYGGLRPMYQWSMNGAPIPGATNSRYINQYYYPMDSVSCEVTSSNACALSSFNTVAIIVRNVGVQQVTSSGSDVSVLPNPNKGAFTVKGSLGIATDEEVSLEITNMLGQVIYTNKVMTQDGNINEHIQLNNAVAAGMYLLNVRSESVHNVYHIVIEQ